MNVETYYIVEFCLKDKYCTKETENMFQGQGYDTLEEAEDMFEGYADSRDIKSVRLIKRTDCPVDHEPTESYDKISYCVCFHKKKDFDTEEPFDTLEEAQNFYNSIISDIDNYVYINEPFKAIEKILKQE